MITYCKKCEANIDTDKPCEHVIYPPATPTDNAPENSNSDTQNKSVVTNDTDNAWLDEVLNDFHKTWDKQTARKRILTHIDTVCREARIDELKWVKSRSAKHAGIWIDTKGNELDERLTQLNPNKDTEPTKEVK